MPTLYREHKENFSEVISKLKHGLHTLPDELQRTIDTKRSPQTTKPKVAKLANQGVHSVARCAGVLLFSSRM